MMIFTNFSVFSIIIYCNAIHQVNGTGEYSYFQVLTDQQLVEQKAVSYANYKQSPTGKATDVLPKTRKSICKSKPEEKIKFCKRILQVGYHGFKFDLSKARVDKCEKKHFSTRYGTKTGQYRYRLSMFVCPPMYYFDLETEKKTFIPYVHHVSKGSELLSAFVFFQETATAPIYPQKFVSKIDFIKLMSSQNEKKLRPSKPEYIVASVNQRLTEYLQSIRIIAPYRKFHKRYSSLNICGLRRAQKIYLCRQNMARFANHLTLDVRGYNEEKCRKQRVLTDHNTKEVKLLVLYCPPAISTRNSEETSSTLYYLSANLSANSMMIFSRINKKGDVLRVGFHVIGLDTRPLYKDFRQTKFMLYPSEPQQNQPVPQEQWRNIEKEINSAGGSVQMPATIARIYKRELNEISSEDSSFRFIRDKWVKDDFVILFSKIKNSKRAYERFVLTYWSLDVCQLSNAQREQLCNDILSDPEYGYDMDESRLNTQLNYSCTRVEIRLVSREADNLDTDRFSMWQCPQPKNRPQVDFYIGKSYLRDSAILYRTTQYPKRNEPLSYIYADALVTKINREKLATVT